MEEGHTFKTSTDNSASNDKQFFPTRTVATATQVKLMADNSVNTGSFKSTKNCKKWHFFTFVCRYAP